MNWNEYFKNFVELTALKSKDPNTKVGAVIVDDNNRIVSIGYNGFPEIQNATSEDGNNDDRFPWSRPEKYKYVIHAEINAILNSDTIHRLKNARIYCTHFPCNECSKLIIQAGIKEIYYINDLDTVSNCHHHIEDSIYMLNTCKVSIHKLI